ncbi:Hypothetical_protein [Hexamita inflata]|uniref:Hypothetical_protein n=1 Tax=Hexamita inflata TaxID=28002 RepID=A0AA86R762_9EUKA|nr:Hypothetical protein HINF_LOCUS57568 [Hexamita inflata]
MKSVRFRSNKINSTQFASWQSAFIFFVRNLSCKFIFGVFVGIVLVGTIQSYRIYFSVIEANVTYNSICRKENILEYQFHSELEKVRSLNKTSQLKLYAGPYLVYSHIIQIDLAHFQQLQQTKFDLKNNSKQVSPVSSVYNYIPTMTLFAHANLTKG